MEKILEERSTNEQLEEVAGSRLITAGMRPAIERNCIVVPSSKLVFISIKPTWKLYSYLAMVI